MSPHILKEALGKNTKERMFFLPPDSKNVPNAKQIEALGMTYSKPGYHFVRVKPTRSFLLITLAGNGTVWDGGRWQFLPAGKAYYTPEGTPHAYHTPKN
ncbi:MAG: cupin domain-containing protein, partial [Verrucomicrobiota bacterium]